jgi:hypothetical protein
MDEAHIMRDKQALSAMNADEAAAHVLDNDISELLDQAEVVRGRRPAKIVGAASRGQPNRAENGKIEVQQKSTAADPSKPSNEDSQHPA